MNQHAASVTVEVVAVLLMMLAEAETDKEGLPSVLLWLGQRLDEAGVVLAKEGAA